MKRTILTLLAMIGAVAVNAQGEALAEQTSPYINVPAEIWGKKMPGEAKRSETKWEPRKDDGKRFMEVTNPTIETFKPVAGTDNGKAVVVCPGGAYSVLAYEKEGQEVAQWLARLGYTAHVLAYRVPNNRVGALQDAQRTIRLARAQGAAQVGIIGFSAGASLSCRAATRWAEPAYEAQDETDRLNCRPDFALLIYPAYLDEGPDHTLTPELTVTEQTPPLFVFGTQDDVLYSGPSCLTIAQACWQQKCPIELHYLPRGGHGYGMRRGAGLVWPGLAEAWLKNLK